MAYHITTVNGNGYRCSCCSRTWENSYWVEDLEEALAVLPTEFPLGNEDVETLCITIKDGASGKEIASSKISHAPSWRRGDAYAFTGWSLFIDEDLAPNRGTWIHQIVKGTNCGPELKFITDRSWSELCDELQDAKLKADIAKAEAAKETAEKELARLRGLPV